MIGLHNNLSKQKLTKFVYIAVILVIFGLLLAYKNWVKGFEAPRQNTPNIGYTIRKELELKSVFLLIAVNLQKVKKDGVMLLEDNRKY